MDYAGPHTTQRFVLFCISFMIQSRLICALHFRRSKRSNKSLGAPEPVDLKKEGALIRELADLALNTIDDIDDDMSRRRLIEIVEAKKQVT